MKSLIRVLVLAAAITFTGVFSPVAADGAIQPVLTRFNFDIVGPGLTADPPYQVVPMGIASRVNTAFSAEGFDVAAIIAQLPKNYTVRAELTGPAFQFPLPLITLPGKPFNLPSLPIQGRYTLSAIRLCDGDGTPIIGAVPQAVAIESSSDPLVTRVTTRQLSVQELQERGVTFDKSNFAAY